MYIYNIQQYKQHIYTYSTCYIYIYIWSCMYLNFWQHKMTQNDPCETGFLFLFASSLISSWGIADASSRAWMNRCSQWRFLWSLRGDVVELWWVYDMKNGGGGGLWNFIVIHREFLMVLLIGFISGIWRNSNRRGSYVANWDNFLTGKLQSWTYPLVI